MSFPDLLPDLAPGLPDLRGRLAANQSLADITWFRVGGPAQALFVPADAPDLAYFLANVPAELPITVIGLGSNLLVRDGGVPGIVIRLGRGFAQIAVEPGNRIRAGAAVPDAKLARAAADAGIAGLAFYRGIPGSIGGALRMNAGAHGRETRDALVEAQAVDRSGNLHRLPLPDMRMTYRHSGVPGDWIFTEALYQGTPGEQAAILKEMSEVADYREANQPIKERTGGSTFKNPHGRQRLEADRCRRLPRLADRRRPGLADALQLPDQRPQRLRRGHRAPGRDGTRPRQGRERPPAAVGDHPYRRAARWTAHRGGAGAVRVGCNKRSALHRGPARSVQCARFCTYDTEAAAP